MEKTIDGIEFICNEEISEEEARAYIQKGLDTNPKLKKVNAIIEDDEVDLTFTSDETVPFERIRRITGYLVGTLDRFNDAKRAEESQRVKHAI